MEIITSPAPLSVVHEQLGNTPNARRVNNADRDNSPNQQQQRQQQQYSSQEDLDIVRMDVRNHLPPQFTRHERPRNAPRPNTPLPVLGTIVDVFV